MTEPGEPGNGATSYVLTPKGKQTDGKSKVKPAPLELSQLEQGNEKTKDREKENDELVSIKRRETKIGHRRINEDGQITYKKQPSSALVSAIQLGIQYSVGRLSSKVERDVLMGDFYEVESVFFPSVGRQETPAHHYSDFRFKAYARVAFRYFRELFHIAPDDFLMSLCHDPLRELANPGASGSLFYCSMDDQFIIKTVQHKEAEFLQKLLPGYYLNLNQNKRTLLPKFFGLYCYQCGGKNIRLVLMNNLLPSGYKIHLKYDLKGSTFKRKASKAERAKSSPTLKDLDFMKDHPEGISLDSETYSALIKTIQRDCRVLESFKIMDYSLLLAIHNVDEAAREKREARGEASSTAETKATGAAATNNDDRKASEKSTDEQAKGFGGNAAVARNPSARNRDDFAAYWEAIPQNREDIPYGAIRARNSKGDRLLLFIGVIDILQSYRFKKRLEHGLKSVVQDGDAISVHRPSFYARRFQEFMSEKVFRKMPGGKTQITRSPSKKRASFNTGRARERIRTSSDTDKHLNRVGDNTKSLAAKGNLSPSLDAGLANAVPGDVSFMGRETKSLDLMTEKSLPAQPVPPHDLSTNTREDSSTTHEGSTSTHEQSTITHEEFTLNEASTTFERSVTSAELSVSDTHRTDVAVNLSQSTPKNSSENKNRTVVFTFQEDRADGPHRNSSGNIPKISVDKPSTSEALTIMSDGEPSTSDDVWNTSARISDDVDDKPSSSKDVPNISDHVTSTSVVVLNVSNGVPSTSDRVRDTSSTNQHSGFVFVDSDGNVEETSMSGTVDLKSEESNVETDYRRRSSTDSEPSVSDSKV